jgi:hypothetical protein
VGTDVAGAVQFAAATPGLDVGVAVEEAGVGVALPVGAEDALAFEDGVGLDCAAGVLVPKAIGATDWLVLAPHAVTTTAVNTARATRLRETAVKRACSSMTSPNQNTVQRSPE